MPTLADAIASGPDAVDRLRDIAATGLPLLGVEPLQQRLEHFLVEDGVLVPAAIEALRVRKTRRSRTHRRRVATRRGTAAREPGAGDERPGATRAASTARLPRQPSARGSAAASGRSCRSSMRIDSRRRGGPPMPRSTRPRRRPRRSSRRVLVVVLWRREPSDLATRKKPAWRVEGVTTPRGTRRRAPVPIDESDVRG